MCDLLDAYIRDARCPLPVAILDHIANTRVVDVFKAWAGNIRPLDLKPLEWSPADYSYEVLTASAIAALASGEYCDVHCWVFTPDSFAELFAEMSSLGLHDFACSRFFDTKVYENEFFVWLKVCNDRDQVTTSWRRMSDSVRTAPVPQLSRHISGLPKVLKRALIGSWFSAALKAPRR